MYERIGEKKVPLTRTLAEQFASMPEWKGERPLRAERIAFLQAKLKDGRFHCPKWAVAYLNGVKYRANGQHSSHVLSAWVPFPEGLNAFIEEFRCDSEEDLCDLFDDFDNPISSRTTAEYIGAHAGIHESLANVSRTCINKCLAGVMSWYNDGVTRKVDRAERAGLIHDNIAFILWAKPFVGSRRMDRAGVVAAMYATWQKNPEEAASFWAMVREETHPDADDPTRTLARFLRDNDSGMGVARRSATRQWPPRAFYIKALHAWNAWRTGQQTALKFHPEADTPRLF